MQSKLPDKCCAHCVHGRPIPDSKNLRTMVRCKAGPPSAQIIPVIDAQGRSLGNQVGTVWPVLLPNEECDAFVSKDHGKVALSSN